MESQSRKEIYFLETKKTISLSASTWNKLACWTCTSVVSLVLNQCPTILILY